LSLKNDKNYAFFDVDGTILNINSMLSFLKYFFKKYYNDNTNKKFIDYQLRMQICKENISREKMNELYYKNFDNICVSMLKEYGAEWFNEIKNSNNIFNIKCLDAIQYHKQQHHQIILVSGGFFANLEPIANYLGVQHILCVEPYVVNKKLTGTINLDTQTIGKGKVTAIKNFLVNHLNINLSEDFMILLQNSYAYGDHISDFDMLSLVGNPIVVGSDTNMKGIANKNGWVVFN
jgi:HAD superfamily hydrolase (TIGR01490 family)